MAGLLRTQGNDILNPLRIASCPTLRCLVGESIYCFPGPSCGMNTLDNIRIMHASEDTGTMQFECKHFTVRYAPSYRSRSQQSRSFLDTRIAA